MQRGAIAERGRLEQRHCRQRRGRGVLLDTWGVASFPWAMLVLLAVGFAIAWTARSHGFKPGRRAHGKAAVAAH